MDDQELAAIRATRLQQLRQNSSTEASSEDIAQSSSSPDAEAKRATDEQMRRDLLATLLDPKARERCKSQLLIYRRMKLRNIEVARISLVSPSRSTQIESILLRLFQSGQLRGRVGEEQLISLLEQVVIYFMCLA